MMQCQECEYYESGPENQRIFKCDPFKNIKEPECLAKWQLLRLDQLCASYQSMLNWQGKMGPLQDKIFKYVQREINEVEETDSWKYQEQDHEQDEEENPFHCDPDEI